MIETCRLENVVIVIQTILSFVLSRKTIEMTFEVYFLIEFMTTVALPEKNVLSLISFCKC